LNLQSGLITKLAGNPFKEKGPAHEVDAPALFGRFSGAGDGNRTRIQNFGIFGRGSGGVKIWAESANELSPWTKPCGQVKFASLRRFASPSLWGEFGGLHACRAIFQYIVPPPNIFLTRLFSKTRLKRKDFQEVARLAWTQEVPSSNLGAPTKTSRLFSLAY
jgi:hypothetical protein